MGWHATPFSSKQIKSQLQRMPKLLNPFHISLLPLLATSHFFFLFAPHLLILPIIITRLPPFCSRFHISPFNFLQNIIHQRIKQNFIILKIAFLLLFCCWLVLIAVSLIMRHNLTAYQIYEYDRCFTLIYNSKQELNSMKLYSR